MQSTPSPVRSGSRSCFKTSLRARQVLDVIETSRHLVVGLMNIYRSGLIVAIAPELPADVYGTIRTQTSVFRGCQSRHDPMRKSASGPPIRGLACLPPDIGYLRDKDSEPTRGAAHRLADG